MSEYRNQYGEWVSGYFCCTCGKTCNMLGTGHGSGKCLPNPKLVEALERANPAKGKPHFIARTKP